MIVSDEIICVDNQQGEIPKLQYFVTRSAFRELATSIGHSEKVVAMAANWIMRIAASKYSTHPSKDYDNFPPKSWVVSLNGDNPRPYFDLSTMDDLLAYIIRVETAQLKSSDYRDETSIRNVGVGVLDVIESMATYYDFCQDQVDAPIETAT